MTIFRFPLYIISGLTILLYFSSCSNSDDCDAPDVDGINALYLQFNMDGTANAFTQADLDSVYIVRFSEAAFDSFSFAIDTLDLFLEEDFTSDGKVIINKTNPNFANSGPPYYTDFKYLFQSYGQSWQVRLQHIYLSGTYTDDGQCEYVNLGKTYFLNDDSIDATASTAFVLMNKD